MTGITNADEYRISFRSICIFSCAPGITHAFSHFKYLEKRFESIHGHQKLGQYNYSVLDIDSPYILSVQHVNYIVYRYYVLHRRFVCQRMNSGHGQVHMPLYVLYNIICMHEHISAS